jgi:hypothetical protein
MSTPHPMAINVARAISEKGGSLKNLLGAADPTIDSAEKCPADFMPQWMAYLSVAMNDDGSPENREAFLTRYGALVVRWHVLSDAQWRRCLLMSLRASLDIALPHDKRNVVARVSALIDRELAGKTVGAEERTRAAWVAEMTAAWAARKDAWAAWAAAEAAVGAAEAVWGARSDVWVAWAARWAARSDVWVAEAAGVEAWSIDEITTATLDAIETEIIKAESNHGISQ